jgi:RHS repeat-associated protein
VPQVRVPHLVVNLGFTYDSAGNVTNDGANSYTYDAEGRPITAAAGVQMTFDALGRAVERNNAGIYTQIVYLPSGLTYAYMNGQTLNRYLAPMAGGMAAVHVHGVPTDSGYFQHADWLGSSRLAHDGSGTVKYDRAYAPFGEIYAELSGTTTNRNFTGQTEDTTPGIYDFLFRQHSQAQGRWLVPDPAGLAAVDLTNPQTWNRYAYVANNPLNKVDPKGLFIKDCMWEYCPANFGAGGPGGYYGGGTTAPGIIFGGPLWTDYSYDEARHLAIIRYGWDPTWDLEQKYSWAADIIGKNLTTSNSYTVNENLALCTAWAESSFDPRASNVSGPGDTGAWGLFQTRQISLTDFNKHFGTPYTLSDIHNSADISAYVGTGYLSLVIGTYHGGDVTAGLTAAGPGGSSYARSIGNCASSLDAGNGVSAFK